MRASESAQALVSMGAVLSSSRHIKSCRTAGREKSLLRGSLPWLLFRSHFIECFVMYSRLCPGVIREASLLLFLEVYTKYCTVPIRCTPKYIRSHSLFWSRGIQRGRARPSAITQRLVSSQPPACDGPMLLPLCCCCRRHETNLGGTAVLPPSNDVGMLERVYQYAFHACVKKRAPGPLRGRLSHAVGPSPRKSCFGMP